MQIVPTNLKLEFLIEDSFLCLVHLSHVSLEFCHKFSYTPFVVKKVEGVALVREEICVLSLQGYYIKDESNLMVNVTMYVKDILQTEDSEQVTKCKKRALELLEIIKEERPECFYI